MQEYLNVFLGADQHGLNILKEKKTSLICFITMNAHLFFVIVGVLQNREANEQVYF